MQKQLLVVKLFFQRQIGFAEIQTRFAQETCDHGGFSGYGGAGVGSKDL